MEEPLPFRFQYERIPLPTMTIPQNTVSRRCCLQSGAVGFGWLALQSLLAQNCRSATGGLATNFRLSNAPATSIIFCFMSGGVSHVDSFDEKESLVKLAGQPMPVPVFGTMFDNVGTIMPSPWKFSSRGESGLRISELFPAIANHADDLCIVRSMTSKANEHAQGNFHFHTGFSFQGYPSAGAWMSYGLGAVNENLPAYVVLRSGKAVDPIGGQGIYSNGFLHAHHQPSFLTVDSESALPNLKPAEPIDRQRKRIDYLRNIDASFQEQHAEDSRIDAAIKNYETAFRMQAAVPEACDLTTESQSTLDAYGVNSDFSPEAGFAKQCVVARRLVERRVPFIELSCLPREPNETAQAVNPWDQHSNLIEGHTAMARQVDRPIAALLHDLKQRGLLDSTIVLFSGEFGRTPFAQGSDGRDHNPFGFSLWLAGGGFRSGFAYGATDDLGYHAVDKPLTVYDLWATVQHQMGIDHEKLTYHFGGRDFRLSDVEGRVIYDILRG